MTDETPTPKRMGRPPKHPDQGKRPNLSLRVSPELYDVISKSAAENGRSLSEEMEFRVTEAFYMTKPAAVKEAIDAALWKQSEEDVERFGGRIAYSWHTFQNHFLQQAMAEAGERFGITDHRRLTSEYIDFVFEKMAEAQPRIRKLWQARILGGQMLGALDDPEVRAELQKVWDADPALRQSIMEKLGKA